MRSGGEVGVVVVWVLAYGAPRGGSRPGEARRTGGVGPGWTLLPPARTKEKDGLKTRARKTRTVGLNERPGPGSPLSGPSRRSEGPRPTRAASDEGAERRARPARRTPSATPVQTPDRPRLDSDEADW